MLQRSKKKAYIVEKDPSKYSTIKIEITIISFEMRVLMLLIFIYLKKISNAKRIS